tara:strand:+ start:67 stop:705 length:639 start_codon:yes stop_codon:yes gene_type:complete
LPPENLKTWSGTGQLFLRREISFGPFMSIKSLKTKNQYIKHMKTLKSTLLTLSVILLITGCKQQESNTTTTSNVESADLSVEKAQVTSVMKAYKDAIQNLTTNGTSHLFAEDSQVYESGGVEGSFAHYVEHHLGPELGEFESFTFSDYNIEVQVDTPYAFTTETYIYTIVLNPNEKGETRTISKKGVATSILKKMDGTWKIIKTHSSSRNNK